MNPDLNFGILLSSCFPIPYHPAEANNHSRQNNVVWGFAFVLSRVITAQHSEQKDESTMNTTKQIFRDKRGPGAMIVVIDDEKHECHRLYAESKDKLDDLRIKLNMVGDLSSKPVDKRQFDIAKRDYPGADGEL